MEACLHPARKRHARFRHQPRATPLWVGDPDDWALIRHKPRPPLVCPEPGCDVALISYENLNNQYNPRIFKFKATAVTRNHWDASGLGGGPPSAEHEWMKLHLSRIATSLGYTATPEHAPASAGGAQIVPNKIKCFRRPDVSPFDHSRRGSIESPAFVISLKKRPEWAKWADKEVAAFHEAGRKEVVSPTEHR
jgi:hypothetical protein